MGLEELFTATIHTRTHALVHVLRDLRARARDALQRSFHPFIRPSVCVCVCAALQSLLLSTTMVHCTKKRDSQISRVYSLI